MVKSRIALLLFAWGPLPIAPAGELSAQAQGIGNCPPGTAGCPHATAEEAVAAGQAMVRETMRPDCTRGGGEIVVCGRRDRRDEDARHRLPLRVEPSPRAADRAGGEQLTAMRTDDSRCTAVGPNQQCTRGLDLIGIGFRILALAAKALKEGE